MILQIVKLEKENISTINTIIPNEQWVYNLDQTGIIITKNELKHSLEQNVKVEEKKPITALFGDYIIKNTDGEYIVKTEEEYAAMNALI